MLGMVLLIDFSELRVELILCWFANILFNSQIEVTVCCDLLVV